MTFTLDKIAPSFPLVDRMNTVLRDFSDRVASLSATESEPANSNLAKGAPAIHTFLEEGCISLSWVYDGFLRHQAVCEELYDQVNDAINQAHVGDAPISDLETMDRVLS